MIADKQRFDATIAAFDAANAEDPNRDEGQPKELLYARRMSAMLARFAPDAPEAVRLAARAQHLQRWKTPRTSFPARPLTPAYSRSIAARAEAISWASLGAGEMRSTS